VKEVVGTVDRVHELGLNVFGAVADLQFAILLALRERLLVPNFNDVFHLANMSYLYIQDAGQ
jgi:hypothetical protein